MQKKIKTHNSHINRIKIKVHPFKPFRIPKIIINFRGNVFVSSWEQHNHSLGAVWFKILYIRIRLLGNNMHENKIDEIPKMTLFGRAWECVRILWGQLTNYVCILFMELIMKTLWNFNRLINKTIQNIEKINY